MKLFSYCQVIFLLSLLSVGCNYVPPHRNYILAERRSSLTVRASSWEFSLAKAVFNASSYGIEL
ncbi:hypothetical protein [Candidatus Chlamydia sanziniae]|uniref:Lipoprotein n=1 Tax=Candidatus Chlamydia sanziniae TaxID=1806891 RepID=A0A1A9HU32_9CHLA|nr:hypothetical protein [Candidatus Chlamydia sanziniae]ANH78355.1 hypothetical protein Cs308_0184 [Candidatus Chlamydia sanziniae]